MPYGTHGRNVASGWGKNVVDVVQVKDFGLLNGSNPEEFYLLFYHIGSTIVIGWASERC
jgi:hypothetical protein